MERNENPCGSWQSAKAYSKTSPSHGRKQVIAIFDDRRELRQCGRVAKRKVNESETADKLSSAVAQLTEEVRILRTAVDELRDDVVWAARQVLVTGYQASGQQPPVPVDPLAPDADCRPCSATLPVESVDEDRYCCDSPRLTWFGDPDTPGVICATCRFLVAELGNVVIWAEEGETPGDPQGRLFDE